MRGGGVWGAAAAEARLGVPRSRDCDGGRPRPPSVLGALALAAGRSPASSLLLRRCPALALPLMPLLLLPPLPLLLPLLLLALCRWMALAAFTVLPPVGLCRLLAPPPVARALAAAGEGAAASAAASAAAACGVQREESDNHPIRLEGKRR